VPPAAQRKVVSPTGAMHVARHLTLRGVRRRYNPAWSGNMDEFERSAKLFVEMNESERLSAKEVAEAIALVARFFREHLGSPTLGSSGETVAVTFKQRKTAALLYDRVWTPPILIDDDTPPGVAAYGASEPEIRFQAILMVLKDRHASHAPATGSPAEQASAYNATLKFIAESLNASRAVHAVPLYDTTVALACDYPAGTREVLFSALEGIKIVDEDRLAWEQVLEFRADPESHSRYRRMLHWLDSEMVGKPVDFIRDEIGIRLEHYENSVRKHGLETVLGGIESLLDPKFISAAVATLAGVTFATDISVGAISTIALAGAKLSCSLARGLIELGDMEHGKFAEIAFVHELKRAGSQERAG